MFDNEAQYTEIKDQVSYELLNQSGKFQSLTKDFSKVSPHEVIKLTTRLHSKAGGTISLLSKHYIYLFIF